jgi:hypothetical protein
VFHLRGHLFEVPVGRAGAECRGRTGEVVFVRWSADDGRGLTMVKSGGKRRHCVLVCDHFPHSIGRSSAFGRRSGWWLPRSAGPPASGDFSVSMLDVVTG